MVVIFASRILIDMGILLELLFHTLFKNKSCCDKQNLILISTRHHYTVADLGGVRGVQMHPPLAASNVFCVHNCTSPSNDYAAVACSNNNQAQLHTHVSVPY